MYYYQDFDFEMIIIAIVIYLFLVISIAKLGTYKKCGGIKALVVSLLFTPVAGIIYVAISPVKSVLKIVHYRCHHCGLEFTNHHKYCPTCLKEGEKHRLERISMRTY
ncbi:MAG: hypothetical protein KQI35_05700 [Bacteroidetes bacterium]|nr:hypothetical protein [Bacteroidota bacterium]